MSYICNITGNRFDLDNTIINREGCVKFGYNSRFRAICYIFTKHFYGECKILCEIPTNKELSGIGMSDAGWSKYLSEKFNYINTYYHMEEYLDIYNDEHVNKFHNLDFIISSDVFEHINIFPGLQIAFNNLNKMLKNGGILIFSVPYGINIEHKEHYPLLYDYKIINENGNFLLENKTINGEIETYNNLCFHGGPGNVLEMRIFSKDSIIDYLSKSGFHKITFHEITKDMNKYGIFWGNDTTGFIITAIKYIDII